MFSLLALPAYLLLLLCATLTPTRADYFIDDTNSTVQYIPNGVGPKLQWHTAFAPEIEVNKSYMGTTTVGECNASQNCHLKFPFQGSGITLYVVEVPFVAINVSITIDSQPAVLRTYDEVQFYQHNFSLYDVQELPTGPHTVDIVLLDYTYGPNDNKTYSYANGTSGLCFDFALVNEALVAPTSTPSTSPAPASATPSNPSGTTTKHSPIAAIVGGVVGGLVVVGCIIAFLLYRFCGRSQKRGSTLSRRRTEIDGGRDPFSPGPVQLIPPAPGRATSFDRQTHQTQPFAPSAAFAADGLYQQPSYYQGPQQMQQPERAPLMSHHPYANSVSHSYPGQMQYTPSELPYTTQYNQQPMESQAGYDTSASPPNTGNSAGFTVNNPDPSERSGPSSYGLPASGAPLATTLPAHIREKMGRSRDDVASPMPGRSTSPPVSPGSPTSFNTRTSQLSPEQLDYVHNLYSMNVPAADIAALMERMRASGEGGSSGIPQQYQDVTLERGPEARGDRKVGELPVYEPRR